jgi:hypothetical protein
MLKATRLVPAAVTAAAIEVIAIIATTTHPPRPIHLTTVTITAQTPLIHHSHPQPPTQCFKSILMPTDVVLLS